MTWEPLTAHPPTPYISALHSISLLKVTSDNSTFVSWHSEFSSSGGQEAQVIEDSRWKRKEALAELKKALEGGKK